MSAKKFDHASNISVIRLVIISVIVAVGPAYTLTRFGLFDDMAIYYDFFSQVKNNGVFDAFSVFFAFTHKFEPILFFIFYLQSLVGISTSFWFIFINFIVLNFCYVFYIRKFTIAAHAGLFYYFAFIALLSYSFFSREIYIMRSMYAFIFLLLFINAKIKWQKLLFFIFGVLTHLSFILFYLILRYVELGIKKFHGKFFPIYFITGVVTVDLILKLVSILSTFTSSGDITVFTSNNPLNSFQSIVSILYTAMALLAVVYNSVNYNEKALSLFCLFLCAVSLSNYSEYQLMNRVAAPALCFTPFLVLLKRNFPFHIYFKIGYFVSIAATLRLLYLFASGKFILPT